MKPGRVPIASSLLALVLTAAGQAHAQTYAPSADAPISSRDTLLSAEELTASPPHEESFSHPLWESSAGVTAINVLGMSEWSFMQQLPPSRVLATARVTHPPGVSCAYRLGVQSHRMPNTRAPVSPQGRMATLITPSRRWPKSSYASRISFRAKRWVSSGVRSTRRARTISMSRRMRSLPPGQRVVTMR
jgi:hypothetical protein